MQACSSHSQLSPSCSGRKPWSFNPLNRSAHLIRGVRKPRPGHNCRVQAAHATKAPSRSKKTVVDFYEILGVDDDVSQNEIRTAYRQLAKYCHPDVNSDGHALCILLNEAYSTLSNPVARLKYNAHLEQALQDEEDDYTGQALSKWLVGHRMGKNVDPNETRAVFVDECACIGCKMCVWCASGTFRIHEQHGRSRVFAQWVDSEEQIEDAIASCPVDCIHWVEKDQLPALEYVMANKVTVTDVGTMMGGAGYVADVFASADQFLKKRKKDLEKRSSNVYQHSEAQNEARQRAADELVKQQFGWLGPFANMFARNMQQGSSSVRHEQQPGRSHVGNRKRVVQPTPTSQRGIIPVERSLVAIPKQN